MDREAPLLLRNGLEGLFTPSRRQKSASVLLNAAVPSDEAASGVPVDSFEWEKLWCVP